MLQDIIEIYTTHANKHLNTRIKNGQIQQISRKKVELEVMQQVDEGRYPIEKKIAWYNAILYGFLFEPFWREAEKRCNLPAANVERYVPEKVSPPTSFGLVSMTAEERVQLAKQKWGTTQSSRQMTQSLSINSGNEYDVPLSFTQSLSISATGERFHAADSNDAGEGSTRPLSLSASDQRLRTENRDASERKAVLKGALRFTKRAMKGAAWRWNEHLKEEKRHEDIEDKGFYEQLSRKKDIEETAEAEDP